MPNMVNMALLIDRRGLPLFLVHETDGYFDQANGGKWTVPTKSTQTLKAIVVPAQNEEVQFDNGGAHAALYKKVYVQRAIAKNSKVLFKGLPYTVMESIDYADHANGLWIYFIKRTDAND